MSTSSGTAAPAPAWSRPFAAISESTRFQAAILVVILVNAAVLGLETYADLREGREDLFTALHVAFTAIYCVELTIRILAYGRRPGEFFRSGWNVFDFVVVVAVFIPVVAGNVTLLRLIRLLRVVRLATVLPDLRVIVRGLARSVPPMAGVAVLTLFLLYVYAIAGTALFGEELPAEWGDAGRAMLSMVQLLTLDDWGNIMARAREVTPWALPFFLSFVLIGGFVVLNIVIAVVINSVEEARALEQEEEAAGLRAASSHGAAVPPAPAVAATNGDGLPPAGEERARALEDIRRALAVLERAPE